MSWDSLGLRVFAQDLPVPFQERLRQRWAQAGHPVTLQLHISVSSVPACPVTPAVPLDISGAKTTVHVAGRELWLGEGLFLRTEGSEVMALINPAKIQEVDLLLAFAEAHRLAGWLPLHAATVSGVGQALSLSGPSGAGKSTAALRLRGAGLSLLAEDQTWWHAQSGAVTGLDRFLRAYPDSVERFAPHLLGQAQGQDQHGKLLLPLGTQPAPPAPLQAIGFLGLEPAPSLPERLRALWECTGVPLLPASRQQVSEGVGRLLREVDLFGLSRDEVLECAHKRLR